MTRYSSFDISIFRKSNNSPLSTSKQFCICVAFVSAVLLTVYFCGILFPLIVYIYLGVVIVAIIAAVLLFGAAILYPLIDDVYYRIINVRRTAGVIHLFFA